MMYKTADLNQRRFELELPETTVRTKSFELSGPGSNDGERPALTRHGRSVRCLPVGDNGAGNTGSDVRLLAIEDLDAPVCERILLMGGGVPRMVTSHDERQASISAELELDQELQLHYQNSDLVNLTIHRFDYLMENRAELAERIRRKHDTRFVPLCHQNLAVHHDWGLRNIDKVIPI